MRIFKINSLPIKNDILQLKEYIGYSLCSIQSEKISIKRKHCVLSGLCRLIFRSNDRDTTNVKFIDIYSIPERDHIFDDTLSLIIKPFSLPLRKDFSPNSDRMHYTYSYPILNAEIELPMDKAMVSIISFYGIKASGDVGREYKGNHNFDKYDIQNVNTIAINHLGGEKTLIRARNHGGLFVSSFSKENMPISESDIHGREIAQHFVVQ